jgi:hypothetical protein
LEEVRTFRDMIATGLNALELPNPEPSQATRNTQLGKTLATPAFILTQRLCHNKEGAYERTRYHFLSICSPFLLPRLYNRNRSSLASRYELARLFSVKQAAPKSNFDHLLTFGRGLTLASLTTRSLADFASKQQANHR